MGRTPIKHMVNRRGDVVEIDLCYPRMDDADKAIQVGLMDVRAADDIRVTYDFDRDGWVIFMLQTRADQPDGANAYVVEPPTWIEQAFIDARAAQLPYEGGDAA